MLEKITLKQIPKSSLSKEGIRGKLRHREERLGVQK